MNFNAKLIEKILGITGAMILVLLIGVLLQNEDKKIFLSSAEIKGASDEFVGEDKLEVETAEEIDDEKIPRNDNQESSDKEKAKAINQKGEFYNIIKVIDGDTVVVDIGGKNETVRLIGINAPETKECFVKEATVKAKQILSDAQIKLETDNTQSDRDKYNRLLRYVILSDGSNLGKTLIMEGFAKEYTFKTAYKYQKEFKNAQSEARKARKGLWADNACLSGNKENTSNKNTTASIGVCYCESNKYNCTNFKTHSEAQSVFECCVKKIGNDIHKLDGNNDGQVCENLP